MTDIYIRAKVQLSEVAKPMTAVKSRSPATYRIALLNVACSMCLRLLLYLNCKCTYNGLLAIIIDFFHDGKGKIAVVAAFGTAGVDFFDTEGVGQFVGKIDSIDKCVVRP